MAELKGTGCLGDYEAACKSLGRQMDMWTMDFVEVLDPTLLNTGLGIELYVAAVKWLAPKNGVLMPHACFGVPTSPSASLVWKSSRFRSRVRMWGYVAYGG